jgi:hypothetical protein
MTYISLSRIVKKPIPGMRHERETFREEKARSKSCSASCAYFTLLRAP